MTSKNSHHAKRHGSNRSGKAAGPAREKLPRATFDKTLRELQRELVIMQEYVKTKGLKIVVIFEGRDAAGKGGVIKRIAERTNPRVCRVVALPAPTERERSAVVLPALRAAPPGRRRNRAVRPLLVQPRRASSG